MSDAVKTMQFTLLSHAGLLVENNRGKQLLFDPWLIGSCYWRSWWNYPPPSPQLLEKVRPDVIYLTHIHWDHFHGSSLKRFNKNTRFVVPSGGYNRIKRDLKGLGFKNVFEIQHGSSYRIDDDFYLSSYHFFPFLDSAAAVEVDGVTLLNLNDCKHMGATLKQIVRRHSSIDFVFRSHSSANSRLSYQFIDDKQAIVDDIDKYIEDFSNTVRASGAKYAVPFASNHCHLHKEVFHFNKVVQTPIMVADYFKRHCITDIELRVMVSGDSWSSKTGFHYSGEDWFSDREQRLLEYRQQKDDQLQACYAEERQSKPNVRRAEVYFKMLSKKTSYLLRRKLKNTVFCYVLYNDSDQPNSALTVDFYSGIVRCIATNEIQQYSIQIHTATFIFNRCMIFRIFSHLAISKRVIYKLYKADYAKMQLLNLIFNLDEYEILPLKRLFSRRSLSNWLRRYREIWLYIQFVRDKAFYGTIQTHKYLKPYKKR